MSRYSGKCDFCSHIEIHGIENTLKSNIYVGNNEKPVNAKKYEDLIPYLSHIVGMAATENGVGTIHLSSRPWPDTEEEKVLNIYLNDLVRIYNRCKRKKIEFDIDEAVSEVFFLTNKDVIYELAARVKEKGKKATYEGLHLAIHEYYRKELVNEMLEHGLDPKEYGYERFV